MSDHAWIDSTGTLDDLHVYADVKVVVLGGVVLRLNVSEGQIAQRLGKR